MVVMSCLLVNYLCNLSFCPPHRRGTQSLFAPLDGVPVAQDDLFPFAPLGKTELGGVAAYE